MSTQAHEPAIGEVLIEPAVAGSTPTHTRHGPAGRLRETLTRRGGLTRWLPMLVTVTAAVLVLVRYGVDAADIVAFSAYWIVCLLVPGVLVQRALLGRRPYLAEDLAFGAVTGLALEVAAFLVLDGLGLHGLIRWWWITAYVLFLAVPRLRRHWSGGFERTTPTGWAWAMAGLSVVSIMMMALNFRGTALGPQDRTVYVDQWYHLSLIEEFMRPGPHVFPQVIVEPLRYHFFSHLHMANASTVSGVSPEIVQLRLWILPMVVLTVMLIAGLARQVTSRDWTGPLAGWLSIAALVGNYLWVDRALVTASPLTFHSPSQAFANPVTVAAAAGLVALARRRLPSMGYVWVLLLVVAGTGAKPTVLPALAGGTGLALVACWVMDRRFPRPLALALVAIVAAQAAWLATSPTASGSITLLGTLHSISIYQEIAGVGGLRALSEGVLLDSLSSRTAWFGAAVALGWLLGAQVVRLVGLGTLVHRRTRRDPAAWLLAGIVLVGWAGFLTLDHVGLSQAYFMSTAVPVAAVLSVWLLAAFLEPAGTRLRQQAITLGAGAGVVVSLVVRGFLSTRSGSAAYGAVESALMPVLLAGVAWFVGWLLWRRCGGDLRSARLGGAVVTTALFAMSIPPAVAALAGWAGTLTVETAAPNQESPTFAPRSEQEAMQWLNDNSAATDVVATNAHCIPADSQAEYCDTRSFMVSALGGRRVVLEGWAYTAAAQELHGFEGRSFATQATPWPVAYELSQAALHEPTQQILTTLQLEYDVEWLVGVRRAGLVSDRLDDLADKAFDNRDIVIYRLNE